MVNAIAALFAVLAALALPATAGAKGRTMVTVCGAEECSQPTGGDLAARIASVQETVDPPAPAQYYRVDITLEIGDGSTAYSTLFVPAAGLIASNAGGLLWYEPRPEAIRTLRAATKDVEPFDRPRAWARYIEPPDLTQAAPTATDGRSGVPLGIAGAALLLAIAGGGVHLARRRQVLPRPRRV
ncbi:MAG TPA: hypothetical protein VFO03_09350 [Gaiellaceae bacterium]|nr:hypothetical protein [Gaiellaceae bacterium]